MNQPEHPASCGLAHDQRLSELFLDLAQALVIVLSPDGGIVLFNRYCQEVTGYTAAEALGHRVWDLLLPDEEKETVRQVFGELAAGDFPNHHEGDWLAKSGRRVTIAWSNSAIVGEHGQLLYVVGTGVDVTTRRRIEHELASHNEHLEHEVAARTRALALANQNLEAEVAARARAQAQLNELASFTRHNPGPVFRLDADCSLLYANPGAQALLDRMSGQGLTREEFCRRYLSAGHQEARRHGQVAQREHVLGETAYIFHFQPVKESGQTFIYGSDISQRLAAEARLEVASRVLRALASRSGLGDMFDAALEVILEATQSPIGYLGYMDENGDLVVPTMTRGIWEKCRMEEKSHLFPRAGWGGIWGESLLRREVTMAQEGLAVPEGHVALHCAVCVPVLSQDELIGQIVVANKEAPYSDQDVALLRTVAEAAGPALKFRMELDRSHRRLSEQNLELTKLAEELRRRRDQAEIASQAKSRFLASMSHELRTPLNAIIGFSEVLQDDFFGDLNPRQQEYVQHILESGKHLLSLINEVLDLAQVEAEQISLNLGEFLVRDLLAGCLVLIREKAASKGLTLVLEMDEHLGLAEGDQRLLRQAVYNLLSNAVKFSPSGGLVTLRARRVSIPPGEGRPRPRAAEEGPWLEISVADQGVGLSPEMLEPIFEEFYQVKGGLVGKTPGAGLGLALSRRFAQMHGGLLWAESDGPEQGSRFLLTLPLRQH